MLAGAATEIGDGGRRFQKPPESHAALLLPSQGPSSVACPCTWQVRDEARPRLIDLHGELLPIFVSPLADPRGIEGQAQGTLTGMVKVRLGSESESGSRSRWGSHLHSIEVTVAYHWSVQHTAAHVAGCQSRVSAEAHHMAVWHQTQYSKIPAHGTHHAALIRLRFMFGAWAEWPHASSRWV